MLHRETSSACLKRHAVLWRHNSQSKGAKAHQIVKYIKHTRRSQQKLLMHSAMPPLAFDKCRHLDVFNNRFKKGNDQKRTDTYHT